MSSKLNKERNEKLALKRYGHEILKEIQWKGYSYTTIYRLLAERLYVPEKQAHFSYMQSKRELNHAVEQLRYLANTLPDTEFKLKGPSPGKKSRKLLKLKTIQIQEKIKLKTIHINKRAINILSREQQAKAFEELRKLKSYPHSNVELIQNTSYNKSKMSINRDAVKEIYSHDGQDAAIHYLVTSENCTLSEANRILSIISNTQIPLVVETPEDIPLGSFYCIKDNELIPETQDHTAICPICHQDITKQIIDNSDESVLVQAMLKAKSFFNRYNPFK